ncbi:claudin-1-like [Protopterus annectens]|uniref:claudin-1-like n=1 Tax=Protopterus annectens TaxID=7888 RepID=UPI001CFBDED6|nr:claudin-1-like [Protopterus annectens]
MANPGLQMLGFTLAFIGWVALIACTAMPQWKMSSYAGDNIVTALAIYEGLWMSCAMQSTGQMQCKMFESLMKLDSILHVTRALMIIGIILGVVAMLIASIGMKCTTCLADDKDKKNRVATVGGAVFIISGLSALIGTSWYGNKIARDFYSAFAPVNTRYEFGQALFVGWAGAALCIMGGAFLCCSWPRKQQSSYHAKNYPKARNATPDKQFV